MPLLPQLMQAIAALAVTLGLLFTAAWVVRHYGLGLKLPARRAPGQMQLVEKLPLNAQTTLHLVQVKGSQHLIATTAQNATLLATLPGSGNKPKTKKNSA
ncbi:MAG: flagellar biosynthetic protein FliO [Proteobacteria bacterium]|nr:flagellar biosynthetic protein FliO [Pseudomonadota bacterium]